MASGPHKGRLFASVMAIIGGAIFPSAMGRISDATNIQIAFIVPCSVISLVFYFALRGYKPAVAARSALRRRSVGLIGRYQMLRRHCLALDLKDDPAVIAEYDRYHRAVWPEILQSLRDAGINDMEIYRIENRLFMIIDVTESFTFEAKQAADLKSENRPKVGKH